MKYYWAAYKEGIRIPQIIGMEDDCVFIMGRPYTHAKSSWDILSEEIQYPQCVISAKNVDSIMKELQSVLDKWEPKQEK